MTINKTTLFLIGTIFILLFVGWLGYQHFDKKVKEVERRERIAVIARDSLVKVSDIQYRKLVADSLKQSELNKLVKDLKIELDAKPKIIEVIKWKPRPVEKPTDDVVVKGDSINIRDYYPTKEKRFITYESKIDISTQKGTSVWAFESVEMTIVISQRKDGIFQADVKVPEWIEIGSIDIQATPMELPPPDKFGWLLGVGGGTDFLTGAHFGRLGGGIRYKKIYLNVGANTNSTMDATIQFEF